MITPEPLTSSNQDTRLKMALLLKITGSCNMPVNILLAVALFFITSCNSDSIQITGDDLTNNQSGISINSQQTLVNFLDGSSYRSVEKHETGRGGSTGYWTITFAGDTFTWDYSDVRGSGNVSYLDNNSFSIDLISSNHLVEIDGDSIVINSKRYDRVTDSEVTYFDSQESLRAYFKGARYKSQQQYETGPTPTGVSMGHWYIIFDRNNSNSDEINWAYSDIIEAGSMIYKDGSSFIAVFSSSSYTVDVHGDEIVLNSITYRRE